MDILDVVFGLHFYQPPTQSKETLKRIVDECYAPLLEIFMQERCNIRFTADIALSLLEQLDARHPEIIDAFRTLIEYETISLVNTAAYHPILPLVPEHFSKRQLLLNESAYKNYGLLGSKSKTAGIFPPEMAFCAELIPQIKSLKYRWIVMDDVPLTTVNHIPTPCSWIPEHQNIACFTRSRRLSNNISMPKIIMPDGSQFAESLWHEFHSYYPESKRNYVIFWMDAETFGHHHRNAFERFLEPFIKTCCRLPINMTYPEELLEIYPKFEQNIPAGSWSTDDWQVLAGIPYPLWKHPRNQWHTLWWKLAYLAMEISETNPDAQKICDKALYSCQTWWQENCGNNRTLFYWALPYFREILKLGTTEQQKTGAQLIDNLTR